ncbi:hypothetical protein EDD16DRAFT_1016613 [Pisolithus croceorrhizus]|nr:hypothetical protein EDD16DRAFT_1016613 [Pisolithus croceorrhizus]
MPHCVVTRRTLMSRRERRGYRKITGTSSVRRHPSIWSLPRPSCPRNTIHPYTKENYAIPSTRCMQIVAVDYAGSIPNAMNSMIHATLARSIIAVETYIKGASPLPLTRLTATGLVLTESKYAEVAAPSVVAARGSESPS